MHAGAAGSLASHAELPAPSLEYSHPGVPQRHACTFSGTHTGKRRSKTVVDAVPEAHAPQLTVVWPARRALLGACCSDCGDYQDGPSAGCVLLEAHFFEAGFAALSHE